MKPVPRFAGTSIRDQRSATQKTASVSNLQWRNSREVVSVTEPDRAVDPDLASDSYLLKSNSPPVNAAREVISPVRQAKFQNTLSMPVDEGGLQLPPGLQSAPTPPPTDMAKPLPDFFADPFGDEAPAPKAAPSLESPKPSEPKNSEPKFNNELRTPGASSKPVSPKIETVEPQLSPPTRPAETEPLPLPANPFKGTRTEEQRAADDQDRRELEDFEMPRRPGDRATDPAPRSREKDEVLKRPAEFSCDEFRKSIAAATIQKVSLDISPPFRPDVIELDEFRKLKTKFDEGQKVRDWQSVDGRKLGRGRLRDLAYENIVIETEFGTMEELPINRISEADLAYLSKNWGLPQECLIEQAAYKPREWQHSKVTWKASNLCHKPLYFEEVNLERYGHTAGPFVQPIVSSAHFFFNIAVLPYKMGVHAPSECQYTLGYYRPGDCAPWIVPPVPISLRGGLYQAAAVTGTFWLIP